MRVSAKLIKAVQEFLARKERTSHPDGTFDSAGRFYPDDNERCECCNYIRHPSRSYPYSFMVHCRSAEHVANLFNVDAKTLRRAVNLHKKGELMKPKKEKKVVVVVTKVKEVGDIAGNEHEHSF